MDVSLVPVNTRIGVPLDSCFTLVRVLSPWLSERFKSSKIISGVCQIKNVRASAKQLVRDSSMRGFLELSSSWGGKRKKKSSSSTTNTRSGVFSNTQHHLFYASLALRLQLE